MSTVAAADGVRLHAVDHGGHGPPVVLVHATGFHARVWDAYLPALDGFRVVAVDQRGHGDSEKPDSGYSWTTLASDVLAVVDGLGLERPAAAGHSSGAAALILAEGMRPGTFSRLVLLDPVTPPPEIRRFFTGDANPMSAGARKRRAVWDSREQMADRLRTGTNLSTWREDVLRDYVEHGTILREDGCVELKCPPHIEAQMYEQAGLHEGFEGLWELNCPVLLLVGESSELWNRYVYGDRLPRIGEIRRMPGGHFFPQEDPDSVAAALSAFLREG